MDFFSLFELAQIKAIHSALEPSADSIYRMRCRQYSTTYHTPLHEVYKLDPMLVLQTLYEEKYPPSIVDEELEELLDILYKIKDPNYRKISQQETEDLVDAVMNKELKRLAKVKKAPTPTEIASEVAKAESIPKSGGMTFGDLEKMEEQSEAGKSGFKD